MPTGEAKGRIVPVRFTADNLRRWQQQPKRAIKPSQSGFGARFMPRFNHKDFKLASKMNPLTRALSRAFIVILLLVDPFVFSAPAQQKSDSKPQTVDWEAMIPGIEGALGNEFKSCYAQERWIVIVQTADVTNDGIPEALVEYCHMGAYTSQVALLRLEHGKPVLAQFRGKGGKIVTPGFLDGASVRNGESTRLLPERHAVYASHCHTDDSGGLASCTVDAYVWVAKSATFDANETVSKEIGQE
jgi:hypothetical protein